MRVTHVAADQREEWNAFAAREPSFALQQSWEWGEFRARMGWKAFRIAVKHQEKIMAGAQMLVKPVLPGLISVAHVPRGPIGDWLDTEVAPKLLSELHEAARRHRAIFLKIEPPLLHTPTTDQRIRQHLFRASVFTNQPQATIVLDLAQDLDGILKQMRKKTRQYIRRAVREGISVRVGRREHLSAFYDMIRKTCQRERFSPRIRAYYEIEWQTFAERKQAALFMALHRNKLLAVRTAHVFAEHAAEFHAGSLAGSANLGANYLLVWEAVKWAKAQGCHTYDLWGIPDEVGKTISEGHDPPVSDRTDGLWGVYRFKRGFSRNIVYYVGSYDYVYAPPLYRLITNKFVNINMLDRVIVWMDRLGRT